MRRLFTVWSAVAIAVLLPVISPIVSRAQIPNAGFETWASGNPSDWATSNAPPALVNVTQSTDHHSGASAAQGSVIGVAGFPLPPALISGSSDNGFPINSRPAALHGFFKYTSVGGDSLIVSLGLTKLGLAIGGGTFRTAATVSQWQEFVANIFYQTGDTPDTVVIAMAIPLPGHIGSTFLIDDLSFGPATGVTPQAKEHPGSFELKQNYPNPFNPTTTIQYTIPEGTSGRAFLQVYDVLGREVTTLVNEEKKPGVYSVSFDGSALASGVYYYRLESGSFVATKKLMLLK